MPHPSKKVTFSGSLVRRVALVCLTLLALPLALYSLFLYREELQLEEENVRATLRAVGGLMAQEISRIVAKDWEILGAQCLPLLKELKAEKESPPQGVPDQFVYINQRRKALIVGLKKDPGEAHVFVHPTAELLAVPRLPFPVDATLSGKLEGESWVEQIAIPGTGLSLSVGASSEKISLLQKRKVGVRLSAFGIFVLAIGGGAVALLCRLFSRPLKGLQKTMAQVAEGAQHCRFQPRLLGFEINQIGREFNATLDALLEQQQRVEHEKIARERVASELRLARQLQQDLLPQNIAPVLGLEFGSACQSAMEVGGDFFDVFRLPGDRVLIAIGDVSGKGIQACLHSLGLRSSVRAFATALQDLKTVAVQVNKLFLTDVKESGFFATLWIGIAEGERLEYASFGHPPALLLARAELRTLETDNPAFGIIPSSDCKTATISLREQDTLLLYTDGATEARNALGAQFGRDRLAQTLRDNGSLSTPQISERITQTILAFSPEKKLEDDIAILAIRKTSKSYQF
jgi:serine phosphatase RsbU (regulator of sigma subunit)